MTIQSLTLINLYYRTINSPDYSSCVSLPELKMKINPHMKRIVILLGILISLTAAHVVFGQGAEGVITYETKINLHRRIPPERAEMKSMIPEFRTMKNELFFKPSESIYKPVIEDEEEETSASSGGGRRFTMRMQNSETYLDQNSSVVLTKMEFMGKEYLIEDSVKLSPWKFGTETKTLLGYECKQAYYTDESQPNFKQEITAWYTDKLRPFLGPDRFNTLPGAVLAVDVNNGERVILAQKVDLKVLKKNDLKIPTSGTKITQAEFRLLMQEQMKKMQEAGGNRMIIR